MSRAFALLVVCFALAPALASAADSPVAEGTQLTFRGKLSPTDGQGGGAAEKTFDLLVFIGDVGQESARIYWTVEENGRGAWPWSDRFGAATLDKDWQLPANVIGPGLLYDHEGGRAPVNIPLPFLAGEGLAIGKGFQALGLDYNVDKSDKLAEREVWLIVGADRFGRNRVIYRDKNSPLAIGIDQRVFFNMGTEHALELRLVGAAPLSADDAQKRVREFEALVALHARLKRPARTQRTEWTPEQIEMLRAELPKLEKLAAEGPLARIVRAAVADAKQQGDRAGGVNKLVADYQGKEAGKFSLPQLAGEPIDSQTLAGKVTVLHFWDYREPIDEPYGQVGYLDFLSSKRKADGVQVLGVAVDDRLANETNKPMVVREVRKVKSFMNLSYPIGLDAGALVKQFGDPRTVGARLPLFVVVGADGKIAHYHVGFYKLDKDRGLAELDDAVTAAVKAAKK